MTETPQIAQVVVPPLGENVSEATITRWLKSSGDRIDAGEPLLEIATDKVESEVPSPSAGILAAVLLPEGAVVHVGDTLAELEELTSSPDGSDKLPASPPASTQKGLDGPAFRSAGAIGASAEETTDVSNQHEHGHAENRVERLPRIRQTIARRMGAVVERVLPRRAVMGNSSSLYGQWHTCPSPMITGLSTERMPPST